jgi:hypothetical protein
LRKGERSTHNVERTTLKEKQKGEIMKLRHVMVVVAAVGIVAAVCYVKLDASAERQGATLANEEPARQGSIPSASTDSSARAAAKAGKEAADQVQSAKGAAGGSSAVVNRSLLTIALPQPQFTGTPKDTRTPNLEPDRSGKMRAPLVVPAGCDGVLSRGCKVTSSDPEPIIGELAFITDGDKEHDSGTYVEIGPGVQWVQVDLGQEREVFAACVWHYHGEARVYFDVIAQLSNDAAFSNGVMTVFNNDHDNSSKLGAGADKEYIETFEGRPFAISGVKGRHVRFYSKGNTSNEMNHYTEIEVYGR